MMYVKYQLRQPKGHIIPKGPDFTWARKFKCEIDNTVISFRAPKHRPLRSGDAPVLAKRKNQLESMPFRSYTDGPINGVDWNEHELYRFEWAFYGPWFTGAQAYLNMSVRLSRPDNKQYTRVSLFHPRALEMAIGDYLSKMYAHFIDDETGKQHYIAPAGWATLEKMPVAAAKLQMTPDKAVAYHVGEDYHVFFPITDRILVSVFFRPGQLGRGSQEERDKRVSRAPLHELMNNIIDSITLSLSPEAQAQQKKALEGLQDTSLVKEYPPLKWGAQHTASPQAVEEL